MFINPHQNNQLNKLIHQLIGIVLFWCVAEFSWSGSCPDQAVGVHETRTVTGITYVSVAKATALSELEGSVELARAEARILAKRQLIERLNASADHIKSISGSIDISICVSGLDVFSKLLVTEKSIRQSKNLYDSMNNSLLKNPTPVP